MRYQRGQIVPITLELQGPADAPPVATVTDPNNALFATYQIPYDGTPYSFSYGFRLPGGAALGTYQVSIAYSIAGTPGTSTSAFDVVSGGDSGGEVISLYSYDRPEARFVLAQLGSGKLVQGRNPHL